jgi:hypothetical protein
VVAAILIGMSGTVFGQARSTVPVRSAQPSSRPASRDELLWGRIQALTQEPPRVEPYSVYLDAVLARRRQLLEQVRIYLSVYPGGPRRDDAVRLELNTLSEIATLSGGAYEPLCRRVEEYLRRPPSEAALHEAAYWAIQCRRLGRTSATSQPSSAPVACIDAGLLAEYRAYVERYPRSRYVPRMVTMLFDAAAARGDRDAMRQLVVQLSRDFSDHAVTALLAAQLRRYEAIGQPFALTLETVDGRRIDTADLQGRPVLIVVWAGFSERARACAGDIEALRRVHPELHVVGVNLDDSEQRMHAACRALGLAWPQVHDGLGWASRFTLEWGIHSIPALFAVDRRGRLAGVSEDEGWRVLAATVLEN